MNTFENVLRAKIKELSDQKKLENKRIVLFGYNGYTERISNFLHDENYRLDCIIDNDKEKQGKNVFNIPIFAPESIVLNQCDTVLIASKYREEMKEQVKKLCDKVKVYSLIDIEKYKASEEKKCKFWLEECYKNEMRKLCRGKKVWDKLKGEKPLVIVYSALGDIFACGLYLYEYEKKVGEVKIVIASKGVYEAAQLFGIKEVEIISEQEMEELTKYVFFDRKEKSECLACSCISVLDTMARYKKISFPKFWAKFFFELRNSYLVNFPSIWDKDLDESVLLEKGLIKGKTVILAPYANTLAELPFQFWDGLADKLLEMNYCVFTNIVGKQKPVKGSIGLAIPLNQIGNYLEFSGTFISLRSGLCDVVGHARCKQIIIFRDRRVDSFSTQVEFFDLHSENISPNAIQYVFNENEFNENVNCVINIMRNNENIKLK